MNGIGSRIERCRHDALGVEIGLRSFRRADQDRFVRQPHMAGVAVSFGVDRHRGDAHGPRRAKDAACDFGTVGDKNLPDP